MRLSHWGLSLASSPWHSLSMRWILLLLLAAPAGADPARVEAVQATRTASGWRFDVTLRHGDTGWADYADGWRVVDESGAVLGTRELVHPHVDEQPFTRSLSGVAIPPQARRVWIETRTSIEGWDSKLHEVVLP